MPLTSHAEKMRRLIQAAGVAAAVLGGTAFAQDAPAPEPVPLARSGASIERRGERVHGRLLHRTTSTRSRPALRTFDVQHNAFSLSLAEVAFQKTATAESEGGFRVDLDFGKTADLVGAFEPEGSDGKEIYKHIQQAYVSYFATPKLTLDFGKYVTPIGAEVIESKDNWNYTRSVLFGYAIPFYHTGLRATITANDKVSFGAYLTNGWNNSSVIYQGEPGFGDRHDPEAQRERHVDPQLHVRS